MARLVRMGTARDVGDVACRDATRTGQASDVGIAGGTVDALKTRDQSVLLVEPVHACSRSVHIWCGWRV